MTTVPSLHVPDEPTARAEAWLAAVHDGALWADVLVAEDGPIQWLWSRWSSVATAGMSADDFAQVVLGYRRELWLWLAGERTWAQACSGLVGRVSRRLAAVDTQAG
jgi:hypothetical protein